MRAGGRCGACRSIWILLRVPERIGECSSVLKTVQLIEHAEAFALVSWQGEHANFHTGFQLFVDVCHVLRQRLLTRREKQYPPLLHVSGVCARLSSS